MIIRKIHIEITILIWVPFLETILNLESQKEISNLDPKTKNNPGCQKEKKKKKKKKKKKTKKRKIKLNKVNSFHRKNKFFRQITNVPYRSVTIVTRLGGVGAI